MISGLEIRVKDEDVAGDVSFLVQSVTSLIRDRGNPISSSLIESGSMKK